MSVEVYLHTIVDTETCVMLIVGHCLILAEKKGCLVGNLAYLSNIYISRIFHGISIKYDVKTFRINCTCM